MSRRVATFLLKASLLGAPILAGALTYVVCDPFRVLRSYDFGNYYDDWAPVELNRDYVSLRLFERHYPEKRYNAFIFGSSRTFPFHCDTWAGYLTDAQPFHYPAASENIYGIEKKLAYLGSRGVEVRYALLDLSVAASVATPVYDATHRLPRELSGESWFDFQAGVMKSYFLDFYFLKYMDYRLTGSVNRYTKDVLGVEKGMVRIDPVTNDYFFAAQDRQLAEDEDGYYARHARFFPPSTRSTPPPCAAPVIHEAHRALLERIRHHFDDQHTDYRIVLAPDYGQVCMNPADVALLETIFGRERVFDFTGVNELSKDKKNFYDTTHLRPAAAERILARVYGKDRPAVSPATD